MRFYEFEAKRLLAKQGIVPALTPGPSPVNGRGELGIAAMIYVGTGKRP